MDEIYLQQLADNPDWKRVLDAYQKLTADDSQRPESEGGPRWADRLSELDDLDDEALSGIHGQLIAWGLLKFQFEDGQSGLMYRVSAEGRQALERLERSATQIAG